jgi:hypothetical protein
MSMHGTDLGSAGLAGGHGLADTPVGGAFSRWIAGDGRRMVSAVSGLVLALACVMPARAATVQINDLYGTGVDNAGALISQGASDPHYSVTSVVFLTGTTGPGYPPPSDSPWLGAPKAYRIDQWTANNTGAARPSQWVAPNGSTEAPVPPFTPTGQYVDAPVARYYNYQTTFTLGAADWVFAEIAGLWEADNIGTGIFLNGNQLTLGTGTAFSYSSTNVGGTFFQVGTNTLDFRVRNVIENDGDFANPTGMQVTITGAYYQTQASVPELDPASMAGGLTVLAVALALVERRRFAARG